MVTYTGRDTILDYLCNEEFVDGEEYTLKTITGYISIYMVIVKPGVLKENINNPSPASRLVVMKVDGDLTIPKGYTVTNQRTSYGLMIYCSGTFTNNGTVTMTGLSCLSYTDASVFTDTSNVTHVFSKKITPGGLGGYSRLVNGTRTITPAKTGHNGVGAFMCGGGGGGGTGTHYLNKSYYAAYGQDGTCFGGGNGGGMCDASSYSNYSNNTYRSNAYGSSSCGGGMLVVFAKQISGTGSFLSEGNLSRTNYTYQASDGGHGGGSITLCTSKFSSFKPTISVAGSSFVNGSAGGEGTYTKLYVSPSYFQDDDSYLKWSSAKEIIRAFAKYIDSKKQNKLTFDATPQETSPNPVTSKGIYTFVEAVKTTLTNSISVVAKDLATLTSNFNALKAKVDAIKVNWGNVTGNIKDQADLVAWFGKKENTVTVGNGLAIKKTEAGTVISIRDDYGKDYSNFYLISNLEILPTEFDGNLSHTIYHQALSEEETCNVDLYYDENTINTLSNLAVTYFLNKGELRIQLSKQPSNPIRILRLEISNIVEPPSVPPVVEE